MGAEVASGKAQMLPCLVFQIFVLEFEDTHSVKSFAYLLICVSVRFQDGERKNIGRCC